MIALHAALRVFAHRAPEQSGRDLQKYSDLYDWLVEECEAFWGLVWDPASISSGAIAIMFASASMVPWSIMAALAHPLALDEFKNRAEPKV